ncbi:ABC transporter substrate-binding protein [Vineibacter terrae]|nr:ABC transporter substrate-binding protein [Vineibacter terrae]
MKVIQKAYGRRAVTRAMLGAMALGPSMAGAARAQSDIKIGLTTDLTGIAASYTRSTVNGVELGIDEVNAAGGLLGRKVALLVRDSQLKPDLGTTHTRDLITREKVDVLIGPNSSAVGLTVSAVARQYQKPVIMTTPNTPRLPMELFHPHFFTLVPSGLMEARAMAEVMGPKGKKFAFIGGDYEASHQGLKFFKERLAKVNPGAEFITEAWPKLGEPDYTSYITKLASAKPDVLFSYLWGADLVGFIKQAKPYGLFNRTAVGTLLFMDDLKALGQEMPDGIWGQMRAPFFAMPGDTASRFVERYRAKYNDYPADFAIMGYEAVMAYAGAIKDAQSVESAALVKALEAGTFDLLRGRTRFRQLDHQGDVPSFIGKTAAGDKVPFKVLAEVERVPADKIWPSEAEVLEARKAK